MMIGVLVNSDKGGNGRERERDAEIEYIMYLRCCVVIFVQR